MCKHFVATLDCIDFYELAIEEFDYLLNNNNMPQHEKESIIQQRRIHLAYLNELKTYRKHVISMFNEKTAIAPLAITH